MSICVITGNVETANGQPVQGARVSARPALSLNDVPLTGAFVANKAVKTETDEQGRFALGLQRGLVVIFRINTTGLVARLLVPDTGTITLTELLKNGRI